ncbi:recombinase family protein [Sedimentibacter sp. zth1]|uniref:recombinase family protein n=1 Tax=Sedimentibacter sp. zth1 TaxID=2816908 RepID=UPI001A92AE48|nr:recombinase family protein [Sedimentibacter sp. zth1]QSX06404.1 recombinase family protein [Sedimentibacter sp. zth1]
MNRVAIYVRLSDEDIVKKGDESESIINQKMMLTDYAVNLGWHIVQIYVDEDYSGVDTNRSRPSFEMLVKDAERGKFDTILCKSQSRFTRSLEVLEKYVHKKFPEWGIRFVTLVDKADSSDKANKKSRQINGLVNEWYVEDLSNDIKNVLRKKMENGQFIGSWAPYGYKKAKEDGHKLVVDEYAAEVIRMIFRLYIEGYGVTRIVKILNEKGIDKPSIYMRKTGENFPVRSKNEFWSDYIIYRILRNEVYIGTLTQGKLTTVSYKNSKLVHKNRDDWVVVKNNHEPIIDEKDFYIVQYTMDKKRRTVKCDENIDNIGKTHLFATKVKCAVCNGPMVKTVINNGHGKKYPYLRCKNHITFAKAVCPVPNRINYNELIKVVEEELRKILNKYLNNNTVINSACNKISRFNYSGMIDKLEKKINNIDEDIRIKNNAIANLYIDKVNNIININRYNSISGIIEGEIKKLERNKSSTKQEIDRLNELKEKQVDISTVVSQFNLNNGLTHQIVQETIENIEIGLKNNDGKRDITIQWKI